MEFIVEVFSDWIAGLIKTVRQVTVTFSSEFASFTHIAVVITCLYA